MKLLTRYIIREHVGPLVFALSALTSLLMLQYVARQLANLAGKGLPWSAIGKFFVLSLPFTVAMTMPMAVLMATLFAFGRLAAEHEITAFKANGVRVRTLMAPVLACALLVSLVMVWFNDQVLPASNHRLRILQQDITRTKPTVALREQVLNPVTDQFFMRVARVNAETNRIYDVVIYDLSRGPERKTIYADSGIIALDSNGQDMIIQLFDGFAQEFVRGDAKRLQRSYFLTQTVRQKGIARGFETSESDSYKGDREMTVCEMHRRYRADAVEVERIRQEYISASRRIAGPGQRRIRVPRERPRTEVLAAFYCDRLLGGVASLVLPKKAKAQPPVPPPVQPPVAADSARVPKDTGLAAASETPVVGQPAVPPPAPPSGITVLPRGSYTPAPGLTFEQDSTLRAAGIDPNTQVAAQQAAPTATIDTMSVYKSAVSAAGNQLIAAREGLDSLAVEIHKKFALSFACLVFVLFGPPIALRFPRGGVGATIGVSIVVFGLYYVCLMGGEALADKGRLPAYVAMWIANVIFTLAGLLLLWRVESTTDASRGGGLRDWWADRQARTLLAKAPVVTAEPA
ncbi:MAG: LptF/LptG family permease [Gemmatimonas sp.]|uniref:LptF/LptG family permease n=1 Tax=Gemmatimonas sp. TaxID=1962908 RepID=UPI00391F85C5